MTVALSLQRLAALAALATSCAAYRFEEQHLYLRHGAEAGELELWVLSEGLHAASAPDAGKVADFLDLLEAGRRHVLIYDWPLQFDLDEWAAEEEEDELVKRFQAWTAQVSVVGAELSRNEQGKPCLSQELRLADVSVLLSLIDEAIDRSLLEGASGDEEPLSWPDSETWRLWREHARARGSWSAFENGTLVVSAPCTAQSAARALSTLLTSTDKDIDLLRSLVAAATSVRVGEGHAELRFEPDEYGWINVHLPRSDWKYDPALHRELQARGRTLPTRDDAGPPDRR